MSLGVAMFLLLCFASVGCAKTKTVVPVFLGSEFIFLQKGDQFAAEHNGVYMSCAAFRDLVADSAELSPEAKKSGEKDWCK